MKMQFFLLGVLVLMLIPSGAGFLASSATSTRRPLSWRLMEKKGAVMSTKGQIRVRFLQDTPKQGKKGEVAFVSAALFQNVLLPTKAVERISDEAWEKECLDKDAKEKAEIAHLGAVVDKLAKLETVQIKKKIGEGGKIFGALTRKALLDQVKASLPNEALSAKMTVLEIHHVGAAGTAEGLGLEDDVRVAGKYVATLNMGNSKVEKGRFKFEISSE